MKIEKEIKEYRDYCKNKAISAHDNSKITEEEN